MEQIKISLNKTKILLWLLFFAATAWFSVLVALDPHRFVTLRYSSPEFIFIAGIVGALLFGFAVVFFLYQLFEKARLIISREGIAGSSVSLPKFLSWSDIEGIKKGRKIESEVVQTFIVIMVKNPEHYIDKTTNSFEKKTMVSNYSTYGSPIAISADGLTMKSDDLYNLLLEKMREYKQ